MRLFISATAGLALSLSAAYAATPAASVMPNGPQPYQAVDPVYPSVTHGTVLPTAAYVPPLLFLKGDDVHGSAAGPQPYTAPSPTY